MPESVWLQHLKNKKLSSGQSDFYGHGIGSNNSGKGGFNGRGSRGSTGRGSHRGKDSFNKPVEEFQGEATFLNFTELPIVNLAGGFRTSWNFKLKLTVGKS